MNDAPVRALPVRTPAAGSSYWCVVETRFDARSFNPNTAGDPSAINPGGRFNPFVNTSGARVPTKYLADHPNGAFAETLMRSGLKPNALERTGIEACRLAQLSLARQMRLLDIAAPRTSSRLASLMSEDGGAYVRLRTVAAALHRLRPDLDGLVWEGRQLGQAGMQCLVLFGDRVSPGTDLVELESLELTGGEGLFRLRAAARSMGCRLPEGLAAEYA